MSYLVLARKYRPQTFDDVIGQEHVARTLQNAIRMDRVAHSFLFTGARGVGKTSTARIFAKALNCAKGPAANPCNDCPSCTEITAGTSMDVFEIDGASNRGIGEIRELREGVRYAPSRDRYKIYIIDEVHMLTGEAFNALLKTLEEPPSHVLFFFATTEPQKIPVTILSRCQRYDLKRVPSKPLSEALRSILDREGIRVDDEALHLVARESEGSVRDSLSLLDQIIAYCGEHITGERVTEILGVADRRYLFTLGQAVFEGNAASALGVLQSVHEFGFDLRHFASEMAHFFRHLTVIRLSGAGREVTDLSESEYASMEGLGAQRSPQELHRMFQVALDTAEKVASSRFPKLTLEMMVVRLCSLGPMVPLDGLLRRLEELEKALPDGYVVPVEQIPSLAPRASAPPTPSPPPPPPPTPPPAPRASQSSSASAAALPAAVDRPDRSPAESPKHVAQAEPAPSSGRPALRVVPDASPLVEAPVTAAAQPQPQLAGTAAAPAAHAAPSDGVEVPGPIAESEPDSSAAPDISAATLDALRDRLSGPLAAKLRQGRLEPDSIGGLRLLFKSELFAAEFRVGAAMHEALRQAVRLHFGRDIAVEVALIAPDDAVETAYEERERGRQAEIARRKDEARSHPVVQRVVRAFAGEILTVRLADDRDR